MRYVFADCILDTQLYTLHRAGTSVRLRPKVFHVLHYFLEHRDHLVSKDELCAHVWPGQFISAATLAGCITLARQAMGDRGRSPRLIESRRGYGYRFVGAVTVCHDPTPSSAPAPGAPETHVAVRSLAVLPFTALSTAGNDVYLGLGMAETIITKLSALPQLIIRPTSAVRQYRSPQQDPLAAGREQRVDAVLDGSLQRVDARLRVTARLLQVHDGSVLWAWQQDAQPDRDLFTVQDAIADAVTQALRLPLSGTERTRLAQRYTDSMAAYHAYINGRYFWNQRTEAALKHALEYFQQAIETDPTYALAYAGLADTYTTLGYGSYLAPAETFPHAKQAALQALACDTSWAEPHTSLAYVKFYYEWDWAGAERAFQHAIALNPHYATAHHWYSVYLTAMERPEAARREIQCAHALDPLSLIINTDIGFECYYAHQYDQAIAQLQTTLEMNRQFPLAHLWLGRAYQQQGRYAEALAAFREASRGLGEWPVTIAAMGYVYGVSGQTTEAHRVLAQLHQLTQHRYVTAYGVALVYAGLGEHDHAFAWLQKALEERTHWLVWLKLDSRWDSLCADPRFVDLLRRIGLPP
jgi:TolB-like protein/Tfp pilus assembly protein PilF